MKATATTATIAMDNRRSRFISPCLAPSNAWPIARGNPATILEKIIIEIPFPIPLSVTNSPSHIKKTVPVTKETTAISWKIGPGSNAKP